MNRCRKCGHVGDITGAGGYFRGVCTGPGCTNSGNWEETRVDAEARWDVNNPETSYPDLLAERDRLRTLNAVMLEKLEALVNLAGDYIFPSDEGYHVLHGTAIFIGKAKGETP